MRWRLHRDEVSVRASAVDLALAAGEVRMVRLPDPEKVKTRAELLAIAKQLGAGVQRDPARDAALTRSFHRMLSRLEPPPKPVDGVPWDPIRYPIEWPGWPRVRMDVRFLEDRR